MKGKSTIFLIAVLGLFMALSSCVKDSDIGQESNMERSSLMTSNLMLSSFDAYSFVNETNQKQREMLVDTTYLEFSSSNFFMDQLSKTNLSFQFKNSLEQDFKVDIEFINDMGEIKYTLHIPIASGSKEQPSVVETNVVIAIPELTTFMEATKLVYKVTMSPSDKPSMSKSEGTLQLQSDATYFLDL